jgi:hypothetical protein
MILSLHHRYSIARNRWANAAPSPQNHCAITAQTLFNNCVKLYKRYAIAGPSLLCNRCAKITQSLHKRCAIALQ